MGTAGEAPQTHCFTVSARSRSRPNKRAQRPTTAPPQYRQLQPTQTTPRPTLNPDPPPAQGNTQMPSPPRNSNAPGQASPCPPGPDAEVAMPIPPTATLGRTRNNILLVSK
ncbi:hypothetical protein ATANTOWER_008334 [Ataeniobius toweri]|uniref:Uncharacterized protein n=1 Tax=Ataeniobius toweri TaxID=208326 RepID=A0ABU7A5V0_9TELE|nr:hypothetical protein [Ataeniobius toweri]